MAATDPGLFNFQQVMDDFYKMDPDKEDAEGRSYKLATAADMASKGFDAQMAESMAQTQAALSKDMMSQQADLAMRNEGEARKQEFDYGMQSMGAQFDYQNEYANAQNSRDLGMLGATGEQDRKNLKEAGNQNRLGDIVKGEQSRLNTVTAGEQERENIGKQGDVDINKIGAESDRDVRKIGAQGDDNRKTMDKEDQITAQRNTRQQARSRSLARAF